MVAIAESTGAKPFRQYVACKGLIHRDGKILLLQESSQYRDGSQAGKWDLPGGRITPGEQIRHALARRVMEESDLTVLTAEPFDMIEFFPERNASVWHIVATVFITTASDNKVLLSDDHDRHLWADPNNLPEDIMPAYRPVIAKALAFGMIPGVSLIKQQANAG